MRSPTLFLFRGYIHFHVRINFHVRFVLQILFIRVIFFNNVHFQKWIYFYNRWLILKSFGYPWFLSRSPGRLPKQGVCLKGRFVCLKLPQIQEQKNYKTYKRWMPVMIEILVYLLLLIKWRFRKKKNCFKKLVWKNLHVRVS